MHILNVNISYSFARIPSTYLSALMLFNVTYSLYQLLNGKQETILYKSIYLIISNKTVLTFIKALIIMSFSYNLYSSKLHLHVYK